MSNEHCSQRECAQEPTLKIRTFEEPEFLGWVRMIITIAPSRRFSAPLLRVTDELSWHWFSRRASLQEYSSELLMEDSSSYIRCIQVMQNDARKSSGEFRRARVCTMRFKSTPSRTRTYGAPSGCKDGSWIVLDDMPKPRECLEASLFMRQRIWETDGMDNEMLTGLATPIYPFEYKAQERLTTMSRKSTRTLRLSLKEFPTSCWRLLKKDMRSKEYRKFPLRVAAARQTPALQDGMLLSITKKLSN